LVDLAADRAPFICQSQSLNIFLQPDVSKRDLHKIHLNAWKQGVKSLYYCRSKSIARAESAETTGINKAELDEKSNWAHRLRILNETNDEDGAKNSGDMNYDECLSCQ